MRYLLFIIVSLQVNVLFSKNGISEYIKRWATYKYDYTTKSNYNWDSRFLNDIKTLITYPSKGDSVYDCLINLKDSSEIVSREKSPFIKPVRWIGNAYFEKRKTLFFENEFTKEKALLGLAESWAILMRYYPFPYKKEALNESLNELVYEFLSCENHEDYYFAVRYLSSLIQDSHTTIDSQYFNPYFENYLPPFWVKRINSKTIVSFIKNSKICDSLGILIGDELTEINGHHIDSLWNLKKKYAQASNITYLNNRCAQWVLFQNSKENQITLKRNGKFLTKKIDFFRGKELTFSPLKKKVPTIEKVLQQRISSFSSYSYIDLRKVTKNELKIALKNSSEKDYIIIDCRGYPNGDFIKTLSKYFVEGKIEFARIYAPDFSLRREVILIEKCVLKNKKMKFKGKKVLVLVNHNSKSSMEHHIMALQASNLVETMGTQSAGANGDVSSMYLPMGIKINFSGLRVTYPNGDEIQRQGVHIDHPIMDSLNQNELITQKIIELMDLNK